MRNLLQDADRDRLAAPLALLATEIAVGGRRLTALPEAEGSPAFPAAASAAAAALLMLPGLREAHCPLADALLDTAIALVGAGAGPLRAVAGGAEIVSDDPAALLVQTPHHRFAGNLREGVLRQEPPGGGRPALRHTGNMVEFRIGRRAACVDVEDTIVAAAVTREGERIILSHESRIMGEAGLFAAKTVEAGRLTCRYEVDPASPVLRVEIRFTAARALSQARVTTALDAVEEEGPGGTAARLREAGAWRDAAPPAAEPVRWARGTPVAHVAVGKAGWPAGLPAVHLRPHDAARVMSVTAQARDPGAVHWLLLRHGPADLAPGETLVVREDRLLAPGAVEEVAALMAAGLPPGLAPDPAPDPGAALRAVAAALCFCGGWRDPMETARRAELVAFAEAQVARLGALPGLRELASALLGADALRRSGGAAPSGLVERLAATPVAGASLFDRALAMLALARAAAWSDAAAAPLGALLAGIGASAPGTAPALTLDGVPVVPLVEAEGVAMLARAAGAAVLAEAVLDPAALDRAKALHRIAVGLLRPLVRPRDGRLEVIGPQGLAPGLQAGLTLAFLAPERLLPPPA